LIDGAADIAWLMPDGWTIQYPSKYLMRMASRPLLEWSVLRRDRPRLSGRAMALRPRLRQSAADRDRFLRRLCQSAVPTDDRSSPPLGWHHHPGQITVGPAQRRALPHGKRDVAMYLDRLRQGPSPDRRGGVPRLRPELALAHDFRGASRRRALDRDRRQPQHHEPG
jgi:hypothetical protein